MEKFIECKLEIYALLDLSNLKQYKAFSTCQHSKIWVAVTII